MTRLPRIARAVAGAAAVGALATGGTGVIAALGTPTASATPEEDCQAVRDRDHQIWLDLVNSLPPGAPTPPEPINPCIAAETTSAAPTTPALPGLEAGASGSGPQVGANAPTNMPSYSGTDIVPVPGLPAPSSAETEPTRDNERTTPPTPTTALPNPALPTGQVEATRGAPNGEQLTRAESNGPAAVVPSIPSGGYTESGSEDPEALLLLIAGLGGALAGATRFGRGSLACGRWPWSGGSGRLTVAKPDGGEQTFVLMLDQDSPRTYRFRQDMPAGGSMRTNNDGSVYILDADGRIVGGVKAPWSFDALGRPVRTWYDVEGETLVQHIDPEPGTVYPILADPEYTPEQRAKDQATAGFVGPGTPAFEGERQAAHQRLADNPEGVPVTPDNLAGALGVSGAESDVPVPPTALQGPDDIPPDTALGAIQEQQESAGVAVTPETWGAAVTGDEYTTPPPGESGDPTLDGLADQQPDGVAGPTNSLQIDYDEEGNPWRVYDPESGWLAFYTTENSELVLTSARRLDQGRVQQQTITDALDSRPGQILQVLPAFRGLRALGGAGKAVEELGSGQAGRSPAPVGATSPDKSPGRLPDGVAPDWQARPSDNGKGQVWQPSGSEGNANQIRIMDGTPRYPNGYVRFYNEHGQPVNLNGKPGSRAETHIPRNSDGSYPLPEGW